MINSNIKRGFTLVETLAAVLLLSLALVGPLAIAQKGLSTALTSKDQNSAFNLAQDAIEYVRFARDTNCLAAASASLTPCPGGLTSPSWVNDTINLNPCISASGSSACYLDTFGQNPSAPTACTSATACPVINYDSVNNDFTYNTGAGIASTIFTRAVQIAYNPSCSGSCNQSEADVTVTVSWSDPAAHSISVAESLYNWQ